MSNLFLLGLLGAFIAIMAGLIKPTWVKAPSRKKALGIYGIAFVVCFIGFGTTHDKGKEKAVSNKGSNSIHVERNVKTESLAHTVNMTAVMENYEKKMKQNAQKKAELILPYEIVDLKENSFPGRKRYTANIVLKSNNATYDQKAQTVYKAAQNIARSKNADVVVVSIEMTKQAAGWGYQLALCQYAPRGGGFSGKQDWTCTIKSSQTNPTEEQLKVLDAWFSNRDKFQKNGMTDEPALIKYLAQSLGLPESRITLPYIEQTTYYSD